MTHALNYYDKFFKTKNWIRGWKSGLEVLSSALGSASSLCLHSLQVRLPIGPPGTPKAGAEARSCLGIQLERREVEKEGRGSVL